LPGAMSINSGLAFQCNLVTAMVAPLQEGVHPDGRFPAFAVPST
jgi:hypothetical protein